MFLLTTPNVHAPKSEQNSLESEWCLKGSVDQQYPSHIIQVEVNTGKRDFMSESLLKVGHQR